MDTLSIPITEELKMQMFISKKQEQEQQQTKTDITI